MTDAPATTGGLGGLGGIVNSRGFGNLLQAAGMSMMGAPRNNPLRDFGKFYGGIQDEQRLEARDARALADTTASRDAMAQALISAGVSEPEAKTLAINPAAAQIRLDQITKDRAKAANDQWMSGIQGLLGGTQSPQPSPESAVTFPGVSDASAVPPDLERAQVPQEYGGASVFAERGAAQPAGFTVGGPIADTDYLEATPAPGPGAEIPLAKPVFATYPIAPGVVTGKHPAGLPDTAQRGTIMKSTDGKSYQYIQLSGGPNVDGEWGWGEVRTGAPPEAQPTANGTGNKTVAWLKQNDPEAAALLDQGFSTKDALDIAMVRQKSRKPAQAESGPTEVAQAQPGQQQSNLDQLYRNRDAVAKYLAQAPMGVSKEALDRGRAYFDIYDSQIKRAEEARKASQPPDAVRALKMRAELAGLQPGTLEYQKFMIAGGGKDSLVTINNNPEGETFAGLPKDVRAEIFKRQGEAQDAADLIGVTNQGLQLLDQGAITGAGSDTKISTIKWAQTLGVPVDGDIVDAANNSETYRSIMAKAVGKVIKNFGSGTGLSDADRQYAEKLAGGDTTLNEPAIRRILAAGSSQAQDQIKRFSTMRDKVLGGDLGAMLDVPDPGKYTPAPMSSGSAPRARNPQTGQTLEWDGSQWRPAQ